MDARYHGKCPTGRLRPIHLSTGDISRTDWNRVSHNASLGLVRPFGRKWTLDITANAQQAAFDQFIFQPTTSAARTGTGLVTTRLSDWSGPSAENGRSISRQMPNRPPSTNSSFNRRHQPHGLGPG